MTTVLVCINLMCNNFDGNMTTQGCIINIPVLKNVQEYLSFLIEVNPVLFNIFLKVYLGSVDLTTKFCFIKSV